MHTIHFHPRYLEAVKSGRKTRTTRLNDPAVVGETLLQFRQDGKPPVQLAAVVTGTRDTTLTDLTDDDASHEDLEGADQLREVLRWHYPSISEGDRLQVVTFHLI